MDDLLGPSNQIEDEDDDVFLIAELESIMEEVEKDCAECCANKVI